MATEHRRTAMDDPSTTTERDPLISPDSTAEAEALAGYQAPSVLAMIALVLGLASPLVFAARILLAVPLFGIAVSLVALAKIAAAKGQLTGRWAAIVGLGLSVACLSAAEVRTWTAQWRMASQARPVAQKWIGHLLAGEGEAAFQMTAAAQRAAMEANQNEPPLPGASHSPLDDFLADRVVTSLLNAGPQSTIKFVRTTDAVRTTSYQAIVEQHFRILPEQGDGQPIVVVITLEQRGQIKEGQAPAWRVANFSPTDERR